MGEGTRSLLVAQECSTSMERETGSQPEQGQSFNLWPVYQLSYASHCLPKEGVVALAALCKLQRLVRPQLVRYGRQARLCSTFALYQVRYGKRGESSGYVKARKDVPQCQGHQPRPGLLMLVLQASGPQVRLQGLALAVSVSHTEHGALACVPSV